MDGKNEQMLKTAHFRHIALADKATESEVLFAKDLKIARIRMKFQQPVFFNYGKDNQFFYIPDFLNENLKLIVEIDGEYHQNTEQMEKDRRRDFCFRQNGYKIFRYTNEQVADRTAIENFILEYKKQRKLLKGKNKITIAS